MAFGNPDRAFEILMTGLPAGASEGGEGMAGEDDYGDDDGSGGAGAGAGAGGNPFAALA